MAEAFVYCWTDKQTNKLYIGSHKGDIDDGYICSSKTMLDEYDTRPQDFSRQIIAEGSWDDMFKFEGKLLQSFDVKNNPSFYNQHNGSGDFRNKGLSKQSIEKMRKSKIGVPSPKKGKPSGFIPWNKGKTKKDDFRIEEYSKKLSVANKGKKGFWRNKKIPESTKNSLIICNLGNNNAGKKISTPYGTFESMVDAAKTLNLSYNKIRYLMSKNKDWKKI